MFNLIAYLNPTLNQTTTPLGYYTFVGSYFACHWLAMANSFVNPIIYCFMSENFRKDLKTVINLGMRKIGLRRRSHMNQDRFRRESMERATRYEAANRRRSTMTV